jgi:hypothetical protein
LKDPRPSLPSHQKNATGPTRLGHPNSSKLQTKNKGVGVRQQQQAGVACDNNHHRNLHCILLNLLL